MPRQRLALNRTVALRRSLARFLKLAADVGVDAVEIAMMCPGRSSWTQHRHKRPAVEAIDELGAAAVFSLGHDTFQHYRSSDPDFYPEWTGIVHISGVTETALPRDELREPHRGFVDADDAVDNLGQLAILRAGGYDGFVPFEPFLPAVHDLRACSEVRLEIKRLPGVGSEAG